MKYLLLLSLMLSCSSGYEAVGTVLAGFERRDRDTLSLLGYFVHAQVGNKLIIDIITAEPMYTGEKINIVCESKSKYSSCFGTKLND